MQPRNYQKEATTGFDNYITRERSIRETEDENENEKLFANMKIASQYLRCIFQVLLANVEIKKIKDLVDKICRIYDGK